MRACFAVVAGLLAAALTVAAPAMGDPDRPTPNPSSRSDDAYEDYVLAGNTPLQGHEDEHRRITRQIGIDICNYLNRGFEYNDLMQDAPDSANRHRNIVGAVKYYCPWDADRLPAYLQPELAS